MMNLLQMRHDSPGARKSSSNSARHRASRICVQLFLPCRFPVMPAVTRTGC